MFQLGIGNIWVKSFKNVLFGLCPEYAEINEYSNTSWAVPLYPKVESGGNCSALNRLLSIRISWIDCRFVRSWVNVSLSKLSGSLLTNAVLKPIGTRQPALFHTLQRQFAENFILVGLIEFLLFVNELFWVEFIPIFHGSTCSVCVDTHIGVFFLNFAELLS